MSRPAGFLPYACAAVLLVLVQGCATNDGGVWSAEGFRHRTTGMMVGYADPNAQKLLPDPWRLDNWEKNDSGTMVEKTGDAYRMTTADDEDGDGRISAAERREERAFDLLFLNGQDNGTAFVITKPMAPGTEEKRLEVLLENFVDGLADMDAGELWGHKKGRNLVPKSLSAGTRAIDGHGAVSATVALTDPGANHAETARLEVVICKTARVEEIPAIEEDEVRKTTRYKVVEVGNRPFLRKIAWVLFAYYNTPGQFDRHRAAFDGLLGRIKFPQGSIVEPAPKPAAPAPPAPAPAPPPLTDTPAPSGLSS